MISEETRKKLSLSKTGKNNPRYGIKVSSKTREKLSIAQKGRVFSKETRKKLSIINTGKKLSDKTKKKLSIIQKGKKLTKEHILKISIGKMKPRTDEYCDAWSDLDYKKDCKKDYCEICGVKKEKKIDVIGRECSNLLLHHKDLNSKNCHPDNLPTLCRSCHMILHHALNRKEKRRKQNATN